MNRVLIFVLAAVAARAQDLGKPPSADWPLVGGDWGNTRYSALARINPSNVKTLKGAWMARLNSGFGRDSRNRARRW
jgi:glucose dehydrogenase